MPKTRLLAVPTDPAHWAGSLAIAADHDLDRSVAMMLAMGVDLERVDMDAMEGGLSLREALCVQLLAAPGSNRSLARRAAETLKPPHPGPLASAHEARPAALWMLTSQALSGTQTPFVNTPGSLALACDLIARRAGVALVVKTLMNPGPAGMLRNTVNPWGNALFAHPLDGDRRLGWVVLDAMVSSPRLSDSQEGLLNLMLLALVKGEAPDGPIFESSRDHALFFGGLARSKFADTALGVSLVDKMMSLGWSPAIPPADCVSRFGPKAKPFLTAIETLALETQTAPALGSVPRAPRL